MKQDLLQPINLTLSGGGARGIFHLGVLQYLDEQKIKIEAISGTSIGAIVGASYLCGVSPKEQLELFCSKKLRKLYQFTFFRKSLLQIDSTHTILEKFFPKKEFEQLSAKLYITLFDITNAQRVCIESGALLPPLMATTSVPLLFAPVQIGSSYFVDGGIVDNIPTYPFSSDKPCIVSNLHPTLQKDFQPSLFGSMKRSLFQAWLFSSTKGLSNAQIQITTQKLHNYPVFKIKDPQKLFDLGYQSTKQYFETNLG